jgi:hypothetical protein
MFDVSVAWSEAAAASSHERWEAASCLLGCGDGQRFSSCVLSFGIPGGGPVECHGSQRRRGCEICSVHLWVGRHSEYVDARCVVGLGVLDLMECPAGVMQIEGQVLIASEPSRYPSERDRGFGRRCAEVQAEDQVRVAAVVHQYR